MPARVKYDIITVMIYLDHAAATPVIPQALEAMRPFWSDQFFNPSSPYLPAKRVRETYEDYKNRLAHLIGAKGNDLIITSGATEANNLAFTATIAGCTSCPLESTKILVLATEHDSVFAAAEAAKNRLESTNRATEVETVRVDQYGRIDLTDFRNKLDKNVIFVSVALVNGELGTIQPLSEIAEIIKVERLRRLENGETLPLVLHSDASQALNLLSISISRLGVDLLTLNSAKVGGPKGVGALYVGHGIKLQPLTYGGGQERGLRAGTENVAGLTGFTIAAEELQKHLNANRKKYAEFTQALRTELLKSPVKPLFLGVKNREDEKTGAPKLPKPSDHQLANFCPVSFPGIDAERLIYLLEDPAIFANDVSAEPVYVSTGAACAASKGEKSKTLQAIGLSDTEIAGSLRISFGSTNTLEGIKEAGQLIVQAVTHEWERIQNV